MSGLSRGASFYPTHDKPKDVFEEYKSMNNGATCYRLVIYGKPETANKLLGQTWRKRKRNADTYKAKVMAVTRNYFLDYCKRFPRLKSVKLDIAVFRSRLMDYDGCVSTLKPVIDGLKDIVLHDDSWEVTGPWQVDQYKCKRGEEKIAIIIEEKEYLPSPQNLKRRKPKKETL